MKKGGVHNETNLNIIINFIAVPRTQSANDSLPHSDSVGRFPDVIY